MNAKFKLGGINPLISFVLVLAFLGIGMGTAAAASPVVSISPSDKTVDVGDNFEVYIAVDPMGNTLQVVQTDLGYDSSKVSLTVADGGMFTGWFDAGTSGMNTVEDITGLSSGVTTAGNLAVLQMHADSPGTFTLDLNDLSVGDADGLLTPTVNDGTVTIEVVGPPPNDSPVVSISPSAKTVEEGDDFEVYIAVDPNGNTLQMVQTDLGYDSSKVSSLTVADGGMFTGWFDAGTSDTNTVNDITGLSSGVMTAGNLAVIQMHADSTGTFTLDLNDVTVGDADGLLTPVVNDGTVTITEVQTQEPGPEPRITDPEDGDTLAGMVTITEVDDSGRDIVYNLFEYYPLDDSGIPYVGSIWTEIGNDTDGTDGWSVDWNTKAVTDGNYYIRATMGDSEGMTGSTQISVILANPPEPLITNPLEGAMIMRGTTINIVEIDESGQDDIVSNLFEYCPVGGSTWTEIGTDTDGSDGWSVPWTIPVGMEEGEYIIRATMSDLEDNTGFDEITINIVLDGIMLHAGWNLFSVPSMLDNASVDHVLEGFSPDAILIYYDASTGLWINVDEIEPLKAYAIKVPSTQTILNIDAYPQPVGSLNMYVGWNLIGMTGYISGSAEDALVLGSIDDSYQKIYYWDAYQQRFDLYGYNCNVYPGSPCPPPFAGHVSTDNFPMSPYMGYWVDMTSDDVYTGQG